MKFDQRDASGVRIRADGKGDSWAQDHRQLGPTFNMTDFDAVLGLVAFAANTGEKLFMEYVPDNYQNRPNVIRQYANVAMFDRKTNREYAFGETNRVSLSWHLDHCRKIGASQPVPPKFFFVIGRDQPPWMLIELDIETGAVVAEHCLTAMNWREVWQAAGLTGLRDQLRRWIDPSAAQAKR